jgi:predicted DNA-binding protein
VLFEFEIMPLDDEHKEQLNDFKKETGKKIEDFISEGDVDELNAYLVAQNAIQEGMKPQDDQDKQLISAKKRHLTSAPKNLINQMKETFGLKDNEVVYRIKTDPGKLQPILDNQRIFEEQLRENREERKEVKSELASLTDALGRHEETNVGEYQRLSHEISGLRDDLQDIRPGAPITIPTDLENRLSAYERKLQEFEEDYGRNFIGLATQMNEQFQQIGEDIRDIAPIDANVFEDRMLGFSEGLDALREDMGGYEATNVDEHMDMERKNEELRDLMLAMNAMSMEELRDRQQQEAPEEPVLVEQPQPLNRQRTPTNNRVSPQRSGDKEEIKMPNELGTFEAAPEYLGIRQNPLQETALKIAAMSLTDPLIAGISTYGEKWVLPDMMIDSPEVRAKYDNDKRFAEKVISANGIIYETGEIVDKARGQVIEPLQDYKQNLLDAIDPQLGYTILSQVKFGGEPLLALDIDRSDPKAIQKMFSRLALLRRKAHLEDIVKPNN